MSARPLESWPAALERSLAQAGRVLRAVRVVAETASTQDVLHGLDRPLGLVAIAFRQTAGRGRLGRAWADTGLDGVALSLVAPAEGADAAERLVLAAALGAARGIERASGLRVGIKWPNDLVVDGRKLGGILIERSARRAGDVAVVGIGINVGQRAFPAELASTATSLALEGHAVDRLDLLEALLPELDAAFGEPVPALRSAFATRDALRGATAVCATPDGEVSGVVRAVEPGAGLLVATADGDRFLAAATTSILRWKPAGASSR